MTRGGTDTEHAMRATLLLVTITLLGGCSWQQVSQGVYEGVRVRDQLGSTPAERAGKPELPADYGSYDSQRKEPRP